MSHMRDELGALIIDADFPRIMEGDTLPKRGVMLWQGSSVSSPSCRTNSVFIKGPRMALKLCDGVFVLNVFNYEPFPSHYCFL